MSELSKRLGKKFLLTTEIKLPRGCDTKAFQNEISEISTLDEITSVNVLDSPSARLFMSSLGASIMLNQSGLEPIFQMVCRDRNTLALESDLISAGAFGIENILALTGDHPKKGASDHPHTKPVYDLDSTLLIKNISLMNQGLDIEENNISCKTNFFVGGAISPSVNPLEPEILKTKRKMDAGAQFFQTQAIFEVGILERFIDLSQKHCGDIRSKVIVGLIPLASERMIKFLNGLPGINIPKKISDEILNSDDSIEQGISMTVDLIQKIKDLGFGGVHVMPVGRLSSLEKILERM